MTVTAARDAKASVPDSDTGAATGRTGPHPIMAVPALAFFGVFALVPLVGVVVLSFVHWDGISAMTWAGFDNWGEVLTDPTTLRAVWLSVQVMVFSWLVQTPISLLLGVLIAGRGRYRAVLGVLYFLPMLLSSAAIAISFKALLDPNFGMSLAFNAQVLAQDWLGDPSLALYVVVFVIAWQFVPFHTLLYQAGVRQIPASLYEAAQLDGAGRIRQFFHITLPQLRYTIITSSTLMLVGSLTYFDLVFVLTGGGPGEATRMLPLDMYLTGFSSNEMGKASTLAVLLVVTGLALALGLSRWANFRRGSQLEGA
ncbi:raffinose/stachyose/melibiose transport system permease protein [Saccharomonospora viridis]|jgi:raffinose/stachyose/melibiose transport system permease protein|uniref:Carbohydrate ABC transporter membrane protein n=2 Tax=Saccharomonospora viridis TaxID=1852 RepID=C7MXR9_SACVD|nr:sugar ABC transporter permease [Saccharomonospora viridis]ACU97348.1 carbohydrate ABC transporter membrane protein [Saccharomonospora viridis DSM 43017]SFP83156.1 raffinose/stachyose/melibiose transport system permease protein [Saccharomonospora viridis]